MSGHPKHSRRRAVRAWTWAGLMVVPVLAIVALGSGLFPPMLGSQAGSRPGWLLLSETRQLTFQGDDLGSLGAATAYKAGGSGSVDQFRDPWQNPLRPPGSPRR